MKTTQELYDFLNGYKIGVISTVNSEGQPNAAIVGFGQTKDLELLFGTDNRSRKYQNISNNSRVAFAIGGETPETIQLEGIARELEASELDLVREHFWPKNPFGESWSKSPYGRYFIVTPTWLRYTSLETSPWDITEITF